MILIHKSIFCDYNNFYFSLKIVQSRKHIKKLFLKSIVSPKYSREFYNLFHPS